MSRNTIWNNLKILILIIGLTVSLNTLGGYAITADEVMLLPPYCSGMSQDNFEPDAYKIYQTKPKSPGFGNHMHHFCHGLKDVIRANKTLGTADERGNLETAIGQFNYVIRAVEGENNSGRYNTYLAITNTEKAKVLARLKQNAEAMQAYQNAIKYNPRMPQAYGGLSDLFKTQGMNDEARKILEVGLKQIPKSKSLQRRLSKLQPKAQ